MVGSSSVGQAPRPSRPSAFVETNHSHQNKTIAKSKLTLHSKPRWVYTQTRASGSSNDPETPATAGPTGDSPSPYEYSQGPTSIAIPAGLRSAGAVFVLAGFLKILIVCFPYSTMAISMFVQGRADLGGWAAAKMIPFAIGILALGKYLLDARMTTKRWFAWAVALGGVVALVLSRWALARPRPSPLDPTIDAYHRQATSLAQETARRRQEEKKVRSSSGLQPREEVRQALEQRQRNRR
jgi:hypothetical protein